MKKLYKFFLVGIMSLMLAACGNDKTNDDAISVEEETEEEVVAKEEEETKEVEETKEEPVTEEVAVEESTVEETKTAEFELSQMDSGFYGGIAWASVSDDTGTKKVLINKDLQIVYELPEGMETGDVFNGKAVVIHSDQESNPGFMILGADGTLLYECSDNLGEDDYSVSLTKDGGAVYEKLESGLTGSAYACVLNDKFEAVAQMEIPYDMMGGDYYFLSDGVYCNHFRGDEWISGILNVKDNIVIDCQDNLRYPVYSDRDRCVGFYSWIEPFVLNPENLDYSGVTDSETLNNLFYANKKAFEFIEVIFNHDFIGYDLEKNHIEGFTIPDFGAKIAGFALSYDGKYVALRLSGADGNSYYTVVNSDGQSLYEPMQAEQLYGSLCVCDGYIIASNGSGITPDGTVFQLEDGTALSGMGENSVAYTENLVISDGCIFWNKKLYQLDGTEVTTVTALN